MVKISTQLRMDYQMYLPLLASSASIIICHFLLIMNSGERSDEVHTIADCVVLTIVGDPCGCVE